MPSSITNIKIKATDLASKPIKGISSSISDIGRSISRLRYAALGLGAALGGFGLGNEFVEANRQLENMTNRIGSLLDNMQAGREAVSWVREFAEANPVRSVQEYTDSFEQLVAAGIDPTTGALKALTAGAVKFGLSAGDVSGVTRAIKQMLAVSNLQKQELNQLSERIPGIQAKMAAAMNMTTEEFIKQTTAMKVSSVDAANAVFKILGENGDKVIKQFSGTWDAAINRMKGKWFNFLTDLGKTGLWKAMIDAIQDITTGMESFGKVIIQNEGALKRLLGVLLNIGVQVGSDLQAIFNGIFGSDGNSAINGMVSTGVRAISLVGGMATQMLSIIENFIKGVKGHFATMASLLGGALSLTDVVGQVAEIVKLRNEELKIKQQIAQLKRSDGDYAKEIKSAERELEGIALQIKFAQDMRDNLLGGIGESVTNSFANAKKSAGEVLDDLVADNQRAVKMITDGWNTDFKINLKEHVPDPSEIKATTDALNDSLGKLAGGKSSDAAKKFESDWSKAAKKLKEDFEKTFGSLEWQINRFAEGMERSLNGAFDDFFDKLINGHMPNLKSAINSFLQDILKMMIRMQTEKLAANTANSLISFGMNLFGGGGGPSLNGVTPTSGGSAGSLDVAPTLSGGQMLSKATASPRVEIVNNTGMAMEATTARMKSDNAGQIMQVVMDSVQRNKGGSRDAFKAIMS